MKITYFHPEPIETIPFLNAGTGALPYFEDRLPVHHATVDRLPDGLSAIVVTADLQGREYVPGVASLPARLLGEAMPQLLIEEVFSPCWILTIQNESQPFWREISRLYRD